MSFPSRLAIALPIFLLGLRAAGPTPATGDWTPLLDEHLTQWEIFLGTPHASLGIPGYTHAADPKQSLPLGVNRDPLHVFTIRLVDGRPQPLVSGQIQLQSEGAEADYRRVEIRPLADFPAEHCSLFTAPAPTRVP